MDLTIDKSIEPRVATSLTPLKLFPGETIGARDGTRSSVRVYNESPGTVALQIRVQQLRQLQIAHARLSVAEALLLIEDLQQAVLGAKS